MYRFASLLLFFPYAHLTSLAGYYEVADPEICGMIGGHGSTLGGIYFQALQAAGTTFAKGEPFMMYDAVYPKGCLLSYNTATNGITVFFNQHPTGLTASANAYQFVFSVRICQSCPPASSRRKLFHGLSDKRKRRHRRHQRKE